MKLSRLLFVTILLVLCLVLSSCTSLIKALLSVEFTYESTEEETTARQIDSIEGDIPEYDGNPYVIVNNNQPSFSEEEKEDTTPFETFTQLDSLGRCGIAYANICVDLMPTEERGSIGSVKPSGWQTVKYDIVDGNYLYNRCHLIGYQLSGENANKMNLITGTRYLNVQGMLPFEDDVAEYVKETNHHVLYKVTPIFVDEELVARGVLMEAYSVEDKGEGICFCVYCFNVQPGITINYADGSSCLSDETITTEQTTEQNYVLNTGTHKFHLPNCGSVASITDTNKQEYYGTRDELIAQGYAPCGSCKP